MKTFVAENIENSLREWILIDAADQPLGRLAVQIANCLRGKNKVTFTPQVDTGAFVVVINAEKVKLTGRKEDQKIYSRFTGFRSGLKQVNAAALRARHPDQLVRLAVRGMLPRNHQSRTMVRRLKVYAGTEHPHEAQKPGGVK
jgi:large subunit ribosomal protein L13